MPFGVTADGFTRKNFTDIQGEIQNYLRVKISKHLTLDEKTGLGNVVNAASDQLAELWEVGEASYNGFDPDNAEEILFVALCLLTGTVRRGATKGVVSTNCNFAGGQTYVPGALVAHVAGFTENRWVNRDTVVTVAAGSYPGVIFEAETAGAAGKCAAGTLTTIAQTVTGWISVTNPLKSTDGQDIETIESLAVRRQQELAESGNGTLPAIRSSVSKVSGVLQVKAVQNTTDYWTDLPPHSFRVIVWDGVAPAADDDAIAQAILDNAHEGVESVGAESGTAIDADGASVVVHFDRATAVPIYVVIDVVGTTAGVAAAIVAEGNKLGVEDDVIRERLKAAAMSVAGVTDIVTCTLGTAPAPVGTSNIILAIDQIPLFDLLNVSVS
jgi:uncharacterized phage protein gp47/JayE